MDHVLVLRLDQTGGVAPGNKHFKLQHYLDTARRTGVRRLLSFGGAWSNHLHALAAAGREHGLETIGIVRGESAAGDNPALSDARAWGMDLVYVERGEYRLRNDRDYQATLQHRFGPCLVIPEGGAAPSGMAGCRSIAGLIRSAGDCRRVVLPVGTGTTLAGIVSGLGADYTVTGISALKGAHDLEARVQALLAASGASVAGPACAGWEILHDYHCGGFARVDQGLKDFMLAFESVHGIPLEPVYTGKMLYAIHRLTRDGLWATGDPVLALHTGGLQGRRGYPWLAV